MASRISSGKDVSGLFSRPDQIIAVNVWSGERAAYAEDFPRTDGKAQRLQYRADRQTGIASACREGPAPPVDLAGNPLSVALHLMSVANRSVNNMSVVVTNKTQGY